MIKHELPPLPYAMDAFTPTLSVESFEYHYGKHHKAYVEKLNKLIPGTPYENSSLEEIIEKADGGIFNNGAQIWNHTFFWKCMSPDRKNKWPAALETELLKSFKSVDAFEADFKKRGVDQFGSGWVWLTWSPSSGIHLETTSNAVNPIRENKIPLLTCDVWEHAYYIDYRNGREKFLETFIQKLVDWDFVAANLANAKSLGLGGAEDVLSHERDDLPSTGTPRRQSAS